MAMTDGCVGIIPARFGASRFPGKLLSDLGGRPIVAWVIGNARRARRLERVIVTTDHDEIAAAAAAAGAEVHRSRADHETGSDRVGEAVAALGLLDRDIVNVQGDEPFLPPDAIDACVAALERDPGADVATLATLCTEAEAEEPSVVKVVLDDGGRALYFSRARIPWGEGGVERLRHIGIYAFRRGALARFLVAPRGRLERSERLEQLRALEIGMGVSVTVGAYPSIGIDTPNDLDRARSFLAEASNASQGEERKGGWRGSSS